MKKLLLIPALLVASIAHGQDDLSVSNAVFATNVTATTATLIGWFNATNAAGLTDTNRFVLSNTVSGAISHLTNAPRSGLGFSTNLITLAPNTRYTVFAGAFNTNGAVANSQTNTFTTRQGTIATNTPFGSPNVIVVTTTNTGGVDVIVKGPSRLTVTNFTLSNYKVEIATNSLFLINGNNTNRFYGVTP